MDFKELLKKDFIIMDGALGTELQRLGKSGVDFSPLLNFDDPELVKKIIRSYAESGSDIVCANTFSVNRLKLRKYGKTVDETVKTALETARDACQGLDALIALDVSSIGQLLEPSGTLSFEDAYEIFKEVVTAGYRYGADVITLETMTDLYELKAALLAVKENMPLPVICSMSFENNNRTFTGCSASAAALTLEGLGADVIGVNCSLGPSELEETVDELLKWCDTPIMVKPNAGLPDPVNGKFTLSAEDFSAQMMLYAEKGVKLLGGCCGTGPEYIRLMKEKLNGISAVKAGMKNMPPKNRPAAVCTPSKTVVIDRPRIIGERINPTGKKLFKEALKNSDTDYILRQAAEQIEAGAEILDINVGLPEIDEKEMMIRTVKAVQSVCSAPLQIDSTNCDVIEAALRVYNGKAVVNSVNGDDEVLDGILPIVKKYGAAVVGLTLDRNGIPKSKEQRVAIAEKILERALSYGIKREDVFIDCLTLTASAEQDAAVQTLEAVKEVKEKLGLKTVLGVSNISFGLPNREAVNRTFLALALMSGLDLPIINPNAEVMTETVRAFNILANHDKNSFEFIKAYSENSKNTVKETSGKTDISLEYAVVNGLKKESKKITQELLNSEKPLNIVSNFLIPVLDRIGEEFENGAIFLPQLILSAETAGVCFDVIKSKMAADGGETAAKGSIILATVKGDIHDIGKNIVKVLLENYGYKVVDLGKDVPEQAVLDAAQKHGAKLVGLSALMTTTLLSMENTISLLKSQMPDCKIMVGGAVLNADYAEKAGADYYASDAKGAVDIAKKVFG